MKRNLLLILVVFLSMGAQAQVSHELRVHSNGATIFRSAQLDSVKFSSSDALFHAGSNLWNCPVDQIDSITFGESTVPAVTPIDTTGCIHILWNTDGTVSVVNPYSTVTIDATTANVTVDAASGTSDLVYLLGGTSSNGSISIATDKKIILALDGLNLTHSNGPAINISSDKKCTLHLMDGTSNILCDGTSSSAKGAFQSKGKVSLQGLGTLQVSGLKKHALQTSGSFTMLQGNLQVLTAASDGLNVDCFYMYDGNLEVFSLGDGIDGDQGAVEINGGHISVTANGTDVKGIGCDSTLTIAGGDIVISMAGSDSKGLRTKQNLIVTGGNTSITMDGDAAKGVRVSGNMAFYNGTLSANANGSYISSPLDNGNELSYCSGIKVDGNLDIYGGTINTLCSSDNGGGRGISVDGNASIRGGNHHWQALGTNGQYTNELGEDDSYVSTCLKVEGTLDLLGGTILASATGRAINTEMDVLLQGSTLELHTTGNGFAYGTSSSPLDGFAPVCIKTDHNMTLSSGTLFCQSTGKGGRGISVDSTLTIGVLNQADSLLHIYCTTSGSPVVSSGNTGGWGNQGHNEDTFKGLPKGIKVDGDIIVNSGYLGSYCSQTSGDPNGEAIESKGSLTVNGGVIEANSYDDAINSGVGMTINGGKIWAYSRGNDALDNNGTQTYFNGGLVIALSDREMGVDASTDAGGHFYINGATVITKGSMGAWDRPTTSGATQKYLQLSVNINQPFCIQNSNGETIAIIQAPTVSGNGFLHHNSYGIKPPPGGGGSQGGSVAFTSPDVTSGTYQVFSNVTISGGSQWHGFYSGATCTTSGTGTNVNAQ